MALIDEIPHVRRALELARTEESGRITDAIQAHRVVGVLGEAEVGKSETIHQAIGPSTAAVSVIQLDLDGAAGSEHVAFLLARQIARTQLGAAGFSILKAGVLVPTKIEAKRVELAKLLGVDGLDEALRDWPSGRFPLTRSLVALERLALRQTVILWIDHLEAPALTPRHPLDLDELLWAIREAVQRLSDFHVVLSGRKAVEPEILGPEAAFHQQGQWISVNNPTPEKWSEVAVALRIPRSFASELALICGGHPATMLLAFLTVMEEGRKTSPYEVLRGLAARDTGLSGRALQHARSLHRLGGQVMIQVAAGLGPYAVAQRGDSPPQEIRKVLGRLRLAGLIRREDGWSIVNPLVAIGIRGEVPLLTAPDWELEPDPDPTTGENGRSSAADPPVRRF